MRERRPKRSRAERWQPRSPLERVSRLGIVLVLSLIAVVAIYPIVFMGLSSFRTSFEYIANPLGLARQLLPISITSWRSIYRFDLPRLFRNTLWYILLASLLTLAVAVPASFTFAKTRFPGPGTAAHG